MLAGTVITLFALAISDAPPFGGVAPANIIAEQMDPARLFPEGARLAKLLRKGMTEKDVRAVFGKDHEPEKVAPGFGLVPTLLIYTEYGVTVFLFCGEVTGVDVRWKSHREPPPPPPRTVMAQPN